MAAEELQIVAKVVNQTGSGIKEIQSDLQRLENTGKALKGVGSTLTNIGQGLTLGVTTPLVAAAGAATFFANELNAGIANVGALGVESERLGELKRSVQDIAIETGKYTNDLADGLYNVVSAFGDTADSAEILRINAMAATGGLASTQAAIDLTSALTKGYGDTTAEAVQHTADLALATVRLGQTTFPELASSMGKVVPLAVTLGAEQEQLFATMATLTGVTGSAAEVSTQMRGALQGLMGPTETMAELIAAQGFASSKAMVEELGFVGAVQKLTRASEAAGIPIKDVFGSVEGQTLALALAGTQAENYAEKLQDIKTASGETQAAFDAQTQGVNKAGATMKQISVQFQVLAQNVGDILAPALAAILGMIQPVVSGLLSFVQAAPAVSGIAFAFLGVAAAIGPILLVGGKLVSLFGAIAAMAASGPVVTFFGVLSSSALPKVMLFLAATIGPVVAGIAAMGAAIYAFWPALQAFGQGFMSAFAPIGPVIAQAVQTLTTLLAPAGQFLANFAAQFQLVGFQTQAGTQSMLSFGQAVGSVLATLIQFTAHVITTTAQIAQAVGGTLGTLSVTIPQTISDIISRAQSILTNAIGIFKSAGEALMRSFAEGIRAAAEAAVSAVQDTVGRVRGLLPFSPAKYGPLSDLDKTGPALVNTFAQGITPDALTSALSSTLAPISPALAGQGGIPNAPVPAASSGGTGATVNATINVYANGNEDFLEQIRGAAREINLILEQEFGRQTRTQYSN